MNAERMERIERFLDRTLSDEELERLLRDVRNDAELRAALVSALRLSGLAYAARDAEAWTAELARVTSILIANEDPQNSFESRVMARCEAVGVAHGRRPPARRRIFFWAPLAAAAALVIAVGGYWLRPGALLGVRVAEVRGAGFRVQGAGFSWASEWPGYRPFRWFAAVRSQKGFQIRSQESGGFASRVRSPEASAGVPLVVGMEIRQGDRVVVSQGGKVVLKYDGEATTIDLHSAVAVLGAEGGAKRVRLDSGLLLCTAAPQAQPFRLETPHGVATVVGTRFALDAAEREILLAVKEGVVELRAGGGRVTVRAGENVVADGREIRQLPLEEAWARELVMRAESGPWDAVDFGHGAFAQGNWCMDARGTPAERLLWNVNPDPRRATGVSFDAARWKRGVLIGRIMILGKGTPSPASPIEGERVNPQMSVFGVSAVVGARMQGEIHALIYTNDRSWSAGATMPFSEGRQIPPDVWHEMVVYFDMEGDGVPVSLLCLWPEDGRVPVVSQWAKFVLGGSAGTSAGLGLMVVPECRVVVKGLKLVPLGEEMPLPPNGLVDKH